MNRTTVPRLRPRRRRRTMCASIAVLVPAPLGALHLYTRYAPGPVSFADVVANPAELVSAITGLPFPRVAILCGTRLVDEVADAVLTWADLYVVPSRWLERIPRENLYERAALAAKLVSAHRAQPIEHLNGSRQLPLPF